MSRYAILTMGLAVLAFAPEVTIAQSLNMVWGLENTYSYYEKKEWQPNLTDNAPATPERYRYFAFAEGSREVLEPWLECVNRVMNLWKDFKPTQPIPGAGIKPTREEFVEYVAQKDPGCIGRFNRTAPVLYFDFTASTDKQFVLERIEITTLSFSEYKGGGFAERQAGYDILLSHSEGMKTYLPEPRLVFKEHGRVTLRFWSDNFYPDHAWVAPMGEYTIEIEFVFTTEGKTVTASTGPFKIEV